MACFIVPATEAMVTTIATKVIEKREEKLGADACAEQKVRLSVKLNRLNKLLWGGSSLLAFEHLWHGEVQPFFPFLTAMGNEADAMEMLHEMSTTGVGMAIAVTLVWGISMAVESAKQKKLKAVEVKEI